MHPCDAAASIPDVIPDVITVGQKYGPAMKITERAHAYAYFEELVRHCMRGTGSTRREAELREWANLGYYAGYFNPDTRERVARLFPRPDPACALIDDNGERYARDKYVAVVKAGEAR